MLALSPHGPPPLRGFEVVNVPALELVESLDPEEVREALEGADAVVFTSKTGVRIFFERVGPEALEGKEVIAIGPKTAEELERRGVRARVPGQFHSGALAELLKGYKKVVALRSDKASKTLREALGERLVEVVIYKTVRRPSKEVVEEARRADAIAVSSAEIARALIESFERYASLEELKNMKIAVIGPEAAKPLEEAGIPYELAPEATFKGIEKALASITRSPGRKGEEPY
ncbi:MAG: uroporphyrinogen-III synthase [Crenarchaeota archaeon]|nr:uroporphyrinogen-III synthase [Thermoproteota archaeon]